MHSEHPEKQPALPPWENWTRQDSEELVALYLEDYFQTLDEESLKDALTIALSDGIDFEAIMRRVRFQQS